VKDEGGGLEVDIAGYAKEHPTANLARSAAKGFPEGRSAPLETPFGTGLPCAATSTSALVARVCADPPCEGAFVEVAGSQREHRQDAVSIIDLEVEAIQVKEQLDRNERGAFVAIDERVIARDPEAIGGGEVGIVWLAVCSHVSGASERRLE
jgi:hypothetical protein